MEVRKKKINNEVKKFENEKPKYVERSSKRDPEFEEDFFSDIENSNIYFMSTADFYLKLSSEKQIQYLKNIMGEKLFGEHSFKKSDYGYLTTEPLFYFYGRIVNIEEKKSIRKGNKRFIVTLIVTSLDVDYSFRGLFEDSNTFTLLWDFKRDFVPRLGIYKFYVKIKGSMKEDKIKGSMEEGKIKRKKSPECPLELSKELLPQYCGDDFYDIAKTLERIKAEIEAREKRIDLSKGLVEKVNNLAYSLSEEYSIEKFENIFLKHQESFAESMRLLEEKRIKEINSRYNDIEKSYYEFEEWHKRFVEGKKESLEEESTNIDSKELTQYIFKYLKSKRLIFDKSAIQRFIASLHSDQITMLWGNPGSGKTTLTTEVANAIGAKCTAIAVQPNWTDNQDLLGYYNIRDRRYVTTSFLEALLNARELKNRDKLHIILLDEMNLAHIEYYFSEILSAMTRADKTISLYPGNNDEMYEDMISFFNEFKNLFPKEIGDELENELNKDIEMIEKVFQNGWEEMTDFKFADGTKPSISLEEHIRFFLDKYKEKIESKREKEYEGLLKKVKLFRYPSKIKIPENVRFVGTINMDHTTKDLSPKVIDRCFPILISRVRDASELEGDSDGGENESQKSITTINIAADSFKPDNNMDKGQIEEKLNEIESIKKIFAIVCPYLSNRFDIYVRQMLLWDNDLNMDDIIVDKILSSLVINNSNLSKAEGIFDDDIIDEDKYPKSYKKLESMISEAKEDGQSFYWNDVNEA